MGRIYSVPFDAISVTNDGDQDIFEMVAAATKRFVLHGFSLTSSNTTDERARLRLVRRSTTGTGGSAATEVNVDGGSSIAATVAVSTLVTTPGTIGDIIAGWQWSQQNELLYLPTPEMRIVQAESTRLALNLQTVLGGTRTWSGYVMWEEL